MDSEWRPATRTSSPAENSSSFDSASRRSRALRSSFSKRSLVAKANMDPPVAPKLPHPAPCRKASPGEPEADVRVAGMGLPRVPVRAAELRRMRVPGAAARDAQRGRRGYLTRAETEQLAVQLRIEQ